MAKKEITREDVSPEFLERRPGFKASRGTEHPEVAKQREAEEWWEAQKDADRAGRKRHKYKSGLDYRTQPRWDHHLAEVQSNVPRFIESLLGPEGQERADSHRLFSTAGIEEDEELRDLYSQDAGASSMKLSEDFNRIISETWGPRVAASLAGESGLSGTFDATRDQADIMDRNTDIYRPYAPDSIDPDDEDSLIGYAKSAAATDYRQNYNDQSPIKMRGAMRDGIAGYVEVFSDGSVFFTSEDGQTVMRDKSVQTGL